MKSYAASIGKPEINWSKLLKNLSRRKTPLTQEEQEEQEELYNYARDWKTCPCGQLSELLPRHKGRDSEIMDAELKDLGLEFFSCVENKDWESAKSVLADIKRAGGKLTKQIEMNAVEVLRSLGYKSL